MSGSWIEFRGHLFKELKQFRIKTRDIKNISKKAQKARRQIKKGLSRGYENRKLNLKEEEMDNEFKKGLKGSRTYYTTKIDQKTSKLQEELIKSV